MRATPWHCRRPIACASGSGGVMAMPPDRYRELIWYTAEQGLDITGFSREIALIDEGLTSDHAQFVTEICIPVR